MAATPGKQAAWAARIARAFEACPSSRAVQKLQIDNRDGWKCQVQGLVLNCVL